MDSSSNAGAVIIGLLIFVIYPFGSAILCRKIATEKGWSKDGSAISGFVFGIFAIFVVLLLPDRNRRLALEQQQQVLVAQASAAAASAQAAASQVASAAASADTIECPRCAEIIKARARVCRFCGAELVPAVTL